MGEIEVRIIAATDVANEAERRIRAALGESFFGTGDIRLEEVVEPGVQVDCEATPEMMETIFFPNNAIHDGGVIVRGGRILQAACMVP